MKDHEINQAVAESFGADCMTGSEYATWPMTCKDMLRRTTVHVAMSDERDGRLFAAIPNYCNDLNAMHEVEKAAFGSSTAWLDFAVNLMNVLQAADMSELDGMTCILQATARQRAEAYLSTIRKQRSA